MFTDKSKLIDHLFIKLNDDNCKVGDEEQQIALNKLLNPQQMYYLMLHIIDAIPKTPHEKVIEFNSTFGVEKEKTHIVEEFKYARLRFLLLLEEILELGYALGFGSGEIYKEYVNLNDKVSKKNIKPGLVEVVDALSDIEYVLYGAYDVFNLNSIAYKCFSEVHRSNMSKILPFNTSENDLKEVVSNFKNQNIDIRTDKTNQGYVIRNADTNKVLKPSTYSPANLSSIVKEHLKDNS